MASSALDEILLLQIFKENQFLDCLESIFDVARIRGTSPIGKDHLVRILVK